MRTQQISWACSLECPECVGQHCTAGDLAGALPGRRGREQLRCWRQFTRPTPWLGSRGQEEGVRVARVAGELTIAHSHLTGALLCRHSRRWACCRA